MVPRVVLVVAGALLVAALACQSVIGLQDVPPVRDAGADVAADVSPDAPGEGSAPPCVFDGDAASATFDLCVFQ